MHLFRIVAIIAFASITWSGVAAEKWNRISVNLKSRTVTPTDPVVNTASGTDVAVTMEYPDDDGEGQKVIPIGQQLFRFPRTVYENIGGVLQPVIDEDGFTVGGPALSLHFNSCSNLPKFSDGGRVCPAIVVTVTQRNNVRHAQKAEGGPTGAPVVTVFSDDHGIEVFAEYSSTGSFSPTETERVPVFISVVKRRATLSWSAGLTFFENADERWTLEPIAGDEDEQKLVQLDDDSNTYKLSASANYMGLWGPPSLGVSFGVASGIPLDNLSVTTGFTYTIRTLPIADSANLTAGVSYSPRRVLLPEYRGRTTVPAGVAASSLMSDEHDLGWFLGISFNFAGGEDQFKTVFAGGKKDDEDKP